MFPAQASGIWPTSFVDYPALKEVYIPPMQIETAQGVIASTNNHVATHPRMEVYLRNGQLSEIRGGGLYGELWRLLLNYPGTRELTWPLMQKSGYWWLFEAGLGTNPKYFKHPTELLEGGNTSERNVGSTIHWSFGTEVKHGPAKVGQRDPRTLEFAKQHNVPYDHCCHSHTLLPTYQVRIAGTRQWITLIEHGRITAFDDPLVRALASRYGNPDEILAQDYVPAIPGITLPGNYNEYARDPGSYWVQWARSIQEGTFRFFKP